MVQGKAVPGTARVHMAVLTFVVVEAVVAWSQASVVSS